MKSNVTYLGAWLLAVGLAFGLAVASPNDSSVMGRLPAFMAQTLLRQPVAVPEGLPSDRTLALITFQRGQHAQAESWIQGMNLRNDPSITWMRMPVVNDPGTPVGRSAVENKLLKHYPADTERPPRRVDVCVAPPLGLALGGRAPPYRVNSHKEAAIVADFVVAARLRGAVCVAAHRHARRVDRPGPRRGWLR